VGHKARLLQRPSSCMNIKLFAIILVAFFLSGCSREPDFDQRPMWQGQPYDVAVSHAELRALGWNCRSERFEIDVYDGACGARVDYSEGPSFTVFGVPRTASSIFLRDGRLKGMNIGIHASSAPTLGRHLTHEFGRASRYESPHGCKLVWSRGGTHYSLEVSNDLTDGYTSLMIEIGGLSPSGTKESPLTRLWDRLRDAPCGHSY
jgi:hypothetical protein